MSKINPFRIISDHFRTLGDYGFHGASVGDLFVFFAVPLILACGGYWQGVNLRAETVTVIVTAFSVFAALLLNLLMLIYGLVQKKSVDDDGRLKTRFLKEIYSNISFTVFVSLLIIVVAVVAMTFAKADGTTGTAIGPVFTIVLVFLMAHFLLTLLMVLKRVHILLAKEFSS